MKRFLLLFSILVCWPQLPAQQPPVSDDVVEKMLDEMRFAEAVPLLRQAVENARQQRDWTVFTEKNLDLADALSQLGDYPEVEKTLTAALQNLRSEGLGGSLHAAHLLSWLAPNFRRQEHFTQALETYRQAIQVFENQGFTGSELVYCYKNAAQIFTRRMDYETANEYLAAALRLDRDGVYAHSVLANLANNFYWQDSLDATWQVYLRAQRLPADDAFSEASLALVGGSILLKKNRLPEAKRLLETAFSKIENDASPNALETRLRCQTALAEIAVRTARTADAERHFRLAESIGRQRFKSKSRELAKLYVEWGDFRRAAGERPAALDFYQKALRQSWPGFDDTSALANPALQPAPVELWAMNAAARKAQILLEQPAPDTAARRRIAHCFDLVFAVAERLRGVYGRDEAKFYLQKHNFDLQKAAALNLWQLADADPAGRENHLARLFRLLENNRAAVLRDALQQQRALVLAGIPDALLHLEDSLRRDHAALQKLLAEESDSAAASALRGQVFLTGQRYADLFSKIENEFPQFGKFSEAGRTTGLEAVRASLRPGESLLSWFDAGERFLAIFFQKNSPVSAFEVAKDSALRAELRGFLQLISDKNALENDPQNFFKIACSLRQKLLPDHLLTGHNSLIIIPDGLLCQLPFEALLTAPHTGNFTQAPWVLRKLALRYNWSAALPDAGGPAFWGGLLHFAPFVKNGRENLPPLAASAADVPTDLADANASEAAATADFFQKNTSNFSVVHLSTHALGGTAPGVECADRRVGLDEIYALRFRASLVALSACETNVGQFAPGEGVLSLARGFAYAGARSLIASYWRVGDRPTAAIFSDFYKKLAAGKSKSEALRQAKLAYLDASGPEAMKSPWHWAAFTLTGEDGAVEFPGGGVAWWVWGLAAVVLALVFLKIFNRKDRR